MYHLERPFWSEHRVGPSITAMRVCNPDRSPVGITDDVEEENVRDFKLDLLFNLSGHTIHLDTFTTEKTLNNALGRREQ